MSTDNDWEKWGKLDPYYGVLTDEKFRTDQIEENRSAFYATGENFINDILTRFETVLGPLPKGRALDFGSGVGRLSIPLARRFRNVVGLDISLAMIAEAQINAKKLSVDNVEFYRSDDMLSNATGLFDFINTYIVLQHIPVSRGMKIIAALLEKLAPGGGFMLHFSVRRQSSGIARLMTMARKYVPGMNIVVNLLRNRSAFEPMMQMNEYPLVEILSSLEMLDIHDLFLFTETHTGILTVGIMGRKPLDRKVR